SAALVRDQRCDLVGHAIPGRLAGAGRRAAGARSSLLEDALAASTSHTGLRHRPRNARRLSGAPQPTVSARCEGVSGSIATAVGSAFLRSTRAPLTSRSQFVLISQTASPAVNAPEGGDRGRKLGAGFGNGGGRGDQDLRRRRTSRVAGNAPRNHSWKAKWG